MAGPATSHALLVARVEPLAEDAMALTLDVPPELADAFAFEPGQHLTLCCADGVRRSYSICASPAAGQLQVGIRQLPDGWFSTGVLPHLHPGDTLEVMTPTGRFVARPEVGACKEYVAIAAGSGITPVLPIARALLEGEPASRVTLVQADRTHASAMLLDEVHEVKDRFPDRFRVVHVLSREQQEAELLSGRLDGERLRQLAATLIDVDTVDEWFLCGPQAMVVDLAATLADLGATRVHTELFHAEPGPRQPGKVGAAVDEGSGAAECEVTIRLDGRSTTLSLDGAGEPVLTAALARRGDLPFACRGGVCGTCRARVVEGTVEMETNWALEPDEVAAGYVLTCQAHPTSARVVLDYDG
ncbi:2Fe-2S iron-sulfur cluster-binding protein [Nocardioides sp. AE5]|uniref:2Fe-2S iron-sulfur cluster-binding protein n=1 Tax=Nocardioides sp. AE5 TaxID=2962573 RepID=UPI0028813793|nr:2Fe-2S iron-sulfur cluster-binding protein [Nocardioides sp. AE5]MDT0201156.1 2Fe-2S iron-sulfur cluster-binding protein [Nocardioides sp. AE5]